MEFEGTEDTERSFRWKLSMLHDGMAVSPAARDALAARDHGAIGQSDYPTTTGITMRLPSDVYVTSPIEATAAIALDVRDHDFVLFGPLGEVVAEPVPVPSFYGATGSEFDGVMTHADRIRLSPIDGCAFSCRFCDSHWCEYRERPVETLLQGLRAAEDDPIARPRHVLISGGTPRPSSRAYLEDVYRRVIEQSQLPVDVMLAPSGDIALLERLAEWGVAGLAINVEVFGQEHVRRFCPEKAALGIDAYAAWISRAVSLLGPGRVRSLLLLGLEPMSQTLAGVEFIAGLGADPVLSPLRPIEGMPDPGVRLDLDELRSAYHEAAGIAEAAGVKLGPRCIPCQHNTLVAPDTSGQYYFS